MWKRHIEANKVHLQNIDDLIISQSDDMNAKVEEKEESKKSWFSVWNK